MRVYCPVCQQSHLKVRYYIECMELHSRYPGCCGCGEHHYGIGTRYHLARYCIRTHDEYVRHCVEATLRRIGNA